MSQPPDLEQRLAALEKQVHQNRRQLRRAKNAKAILVLGIVLFMVFEIDSPLPWGGRLKSERLDLAKAGEIILLGAWAVGAIALEDLLQIKLRTSKPSERDDKEDERGD